MASLFSRIVAAVNLRAAYSTYRLEYWKLDTMCATYYHFDHDCICDVCSGKRACGCGNH